METNLHPLYGYPILLTKLELENYTLQFETLHNQKPKLSLFEGPSLNFSHTDILLYFDEVRSLVIMAPYLPYERVRLKKIHEVETLQNTLRRLSMQLAGLIVNNYEQCEGIILPGYSPESNFLGRKYRPKYLFIVTDFKRMQEDGQSDIFAKQYGEKVCVHTELLPYILGDRAEPQHGQHEAYELFCKKYLLKDLQSTEEVDKW